MIPASRFPPGTELPFREFMEIALYDPEHGYYSGARSPVGRAGDYVTSPAISPVFAFSLARLVREVVERSGDGLCAVVDIGCGDGSLLAAIASELRSDRIEYLGIDRRLGRTGEPERGIRFADSLDAMPADRTLVVLANELYDAFPFSRLVRRESGWNELWVRSGADGELDWIERPAPPEYVSYLESAGVAFVTGQFADVSTGWGSFHRDLCRRVERGLVVVFDYGFRAEKLFDVRIRKYGTAASYSGHQVHRDLLRSPGGQDLTAHVNFTDLDEAGRESGLETLAFLRQAEFLLRLGAAEHPLLQPVEEGNMEALESLRERRESARRLVLPDGIGEEISVLVQGRGVESEGWSFHKRLW